MNRIIAFALLLVGMSLGMASRASAQYPSVIVKVPFDFAVGNRVLPPETYKISPSGAFLSFNSNDWKHSVFALGLQSNSTTDGRDKLVFDYVNGRYFLRGIVSNWKRLSVQFPLSNAERKSQEMRASTRDVYTETASR